MNSLLNRFTYSTLQITVENQSGAVTTGTSFLFAFEHDVLCLITNKHVIADYRKVTTTFTKSDGTDTPLYGQNVPCDITSCLGNVVLHPDRDVDLAAIPIAPIVRAAEEKGIELFLCAYTLDSIPSEDERKVIYPGTNVLAIGYPLSIIDRKNNLPIVRKGVIATTPTIDFNGEHGFLLDITCQKGSSGSPVVAWNHKVTMDDANRRAVHEEGCSLLGIVCASYQTAMTANLKVGTSERDAALKLEYPADLAVVVPSWDLLEINRLIKDRFFRNGS